MSVCIVDYGSGNLRSVAKAFEWAVAEADLTMTVTVTADPDQVAAADHVVLPGVGAFADCKRGLTAVAGMPDAIHCAVRERGRPFLGICVGMQLMAARGWENGLTEGFGWLEAEVDSIMPLDASLKIPHMGWNELKFSEFCHPVLKDLDDGAHAYFVHSYHMVCSDQADILAATDYGGPVTAAVGRDNLFGTQFHPEKSQANGLKLIRNFLNWTP